MITAKCPAVNNHKKTPYSKMVIPKYDHSNKISTYFDDTFRFNAANTYKNNFLLLAFEI